MEFKDRLGALRRAEHFNQVDLAELAGVSVDTLKRWEAGKQLPRLDELIRLAGALGMTVGALIDESTTPPLPQGEDPLPSYARRKRKDDINKIIIRVGSLEVEVPATPEGFAFVERKLGDFKIDEIPQQAFVENLQNKE